MTSNPPRASLWRRSLGATDAAARFDLDAIYGDPLLVDERRQRLVAVLQHFENAYGDIPVHVIRAPGRINLRGMHVDTHGGWLNLMSHQREVIVVAGLSSDGNTHVVNTGSNFTSLTLALDDLPARDGRSWQEFIASSEVQAHIAESPGHWRNYIEGAWLRACQALPDINVGGLCIVVDSNLPQGAALSSSAALCIALLQAWVSWNDSLPGNDELILAAQDAEWYTGSRCGTCDQAAIVLARPSAVIHAALYPKAFTTKDARVIPLPPGLGILVINSFTTRSISGAEKIAYTLNRFAYSMAMEIFQHALREGGYADKVIEACARLSSITPQALGGHDALYRVLRQVPETLSLEELRARYNFPNLDREYARYFGDIAPALQPQEISLRGPLLFGIAESERARHFALALESGDFVRAGRLMCIGHDGDRRRTPEGYLATQRTDDAWLEQCALAGVPIECCPGVYGASSPALDFLVDAALAHGALGASLTGAGIAGTVLALCLSHQVNEIALGVCTAMGGEAYSRLLGLGSPLSEAQLSEAVLLNLPSRGAGQLAWNAV